LNGGITGTSEGTLKFSGEPEVNDGQGRFAITWNGIEVIDLGGSTEFPDDLGFAPITCDPAPCDDQSSFDLIYSAHVPPGDPSGFGGVPYGLNLKGTVRFLDGKLKTDTGNIVAGPLGPRIRSINELPEDTEVDQMCVGDCFDYSVEGAGSPSVVLPLAGGIPLNPVWRVLVDDIWSNFDTSTGGTLQSAPLPDNGECPDPGDAAYREITVGDFCLEITTSDTGNISGMGGGGDAGGGEEFVDKRKHNTSGCTLAGSNTPLQKHSEWWLLTGFLAWLGWGRRKHARID
jgi:hypothetical protein